MKHSIDSTTRVLGLLAALGLGCSAPVAPEDPPASDGTGASNGGSGSAGSSGSSGSTGGSGGSSGGSSGTGGSGGNTSAPPDDPTVVLPGVDVPLDVPPVGCLRGFVDGALSLTLDATVSAVQLEARDGTLFANGKACTDASGAEVALASLTALQINGGVQANGVILDLGSGDWSSLLATPDSIELTLGEGDNGLLIRGTSAVDDYHHGMRGGALVLDFVGDGNVNLVATGVDELGVSLGGGDDRLSDLTAFRAAAVAAAAAAVEAGDDPLPAPGANAPPVGPLTVALVAFGADGNDWIAGSTADDTLDGGLGDDVLSGLGGNDSFLTAEESDGADILNGGAGYDDTSYDRRVTDLSLYLCVSGAVLGCSAGECDCSHGSGATDEGDCIVNLEDVAGGAGNDMMEGTEVSESMSGGPGEDTLFGWGGSDLLHGERGVDRLVGGLDGDICDGQPGEDVTECEL